VNDNARESESLVSNRDKKHATFVASERFARVDGSYAHERRRSQRSGLSYRSESRSKTAEDDASRRVATPGIFSPRSFPLPRPAVEWQEATVAKLEK